MAIFLLTQASDDVSPPNQARIRWSGFLRARRRSVNSFRSSNVHLDGFGDPSAG
jgi:hypothetical protein